MRNEPATGLSPQESRDLRRLAGFMIPPDTEFGVPGADDPVILADIEASLGRDLGDIKLALAELAGGAFTDLEETQAEALAAALLARTDTPVTTLGRVVLQCYYRDARVVRSLGLEPRPPFPEGHTLEQGDWSLLDPVRARPKMWREAP